MTKYGPKIVLCHMGLSASAKIHAMTVWTEIAMGMTTMASTEMILEFATPEKLLAVDPAEGLLSRARERFSGHDHVDFALGDIVDTGQPDNAFDCVIVHTVYSHIDDQESALREAWRILKPGGVLAVFDGDYATNTVALFDGDPLQAAMTAAQRHLIHAPYIMRRLPDMMLERGFAVEQVNGHGYVQTHAPDYLESLMARGVDTAARRGEIAPELAEGFKAETKRRIADGTFYGAIVFISILARKPG